jgi:hypothetical protein
MAFGYGGGILGIVALICAIWVIYDVLANQKVAASATLGCSEMYRSISDITRSYLMA